MSTDAVNAALRRLIEDADFAARFQENPVQALSGLDLNEDEREALRRIDIEQLRALGAEEGLIGPVNEEFHGDRCPQRSRS